MKININKDVIDREEFKNYLALVTIAMWVVSVFVVIIYDEYGMDGMLFINIIMLILTSLLMIKMYSKDYRQWQRENTDINDYDE